MSGNGALKYIDHFYLPSNELTCGAKRNGKMKKKLNIIADYNGFMSSIDKADQIVT